MSKKSKALSKNRESIPADVKPGKKNNTQQGVEWNRMMHWLIVLVAILPVLFSEKVIEPVLSVRYLFLGVFTALFILIFFLRDRKIFSDSYPLLIKAVFAAGLVYVAWNIICLIPAINPHEGIYVIVRQLLNVVVLFLVTISVINEEALLIRLAKALTLTSMLHAAVGILQFYEVAFTSLPGNFLPYGFMANRNLYGSAQMLLLPFSLLVLMHGSKGWKYVASIATIGIIISVFISQTRSSWLATFVVFMVTVSLFIFLSSANRKKWIQGSLAGAAIILVVLGIFFSTSKNERFIKSIKERIPGLAQGDTTSTRAKKNTTDRTGIWLKTAELIKKNPVMGVGVGNWKIAVPAMGSEGMSWEEGHYVPDRPHNVYLHVASESGITGALLYAAIWFIIIFMGVKIIIHSKSEERKAVAIFMLALISGFAIDGIFSFPEERIEHMLYVTLACGIIMGLYYNQFYTESNKKNIFPRPLAGLLLLIAAVNIFMGYKKYDFEKHMNMAKAYEKAKRYPEVLKEVSEGKNSFVTLDPNGKPIELYASIAHKETKNYPMALKEGFAAQKYHPNSFMIYNNIGTIYTDMRDFDKAVEYYQVALNYTPKSKFTLFNMASTLFRMQRYTECMEMVRKADWPDSKYLKILYDSSQVYLGVEHPIPY